MAKPDEHKSLLRPTLDIVFKMLAGSADSQPILVPLLTAILRPPKPIEIAEVLNPEIPRRLVDDKGTVLDILVKLSDGSRINVEMQAANKRVIQPRTLYYWARTHADRLLG